MVRAQSVPRTNSLLPESYKNKRDAAVDLALAGFSVMPLPPNSKSAPPEGWRKSPKMAPEEADSFWSDTPKFNLAIMTGENFIVLDFDKKHGGCESYKKLRALDDLPDTYTVQTQGGGFHVFLATTIKYGVGVRILDHACLPGVDLRGAGGYVVAAGSEIDGRYYVNLNNLPIAPAPTWLHKALADHDARDKSDSRHIPILELDTDNNIEAAVKYLESAAPEAVEGAGGDQTTFAVACWVRDLGISESSALDLILNHWNQTKACPPWNPAELETKVANAFEYGQNQHGSKAAVLAVNEFPPLPQEIIDAIMGKGPATKKKPESRERPNILIEARQDVTEPDTPWLVAGLIPQNTIGSIYGEPGSFKSFVALYVADMVAANRPVLGRSTKIPLADVIYVAAEGGAGLRKRLDAAEQVHGHAPSRVGFIRQSLDFRSSLTDCTDLLAAIKTQGWNPSLIIIDTLARSFGGGNENASEDMGAFINIVDHIRRETQAAILIIHHSGKDATRGARGHSSFFAAIDFEFEATKIASVPQEGPGVGSGRLRVTKQKDGVDGFSLDYALEKVILGSDAGESAEYHSDEDGDEPPDVRSSIAVREWRDGEARAVELNEVKMSAAAHQSLLVLQGLTIETEPAEIGGSIEIRSDVWRRSVVDRGICSGDEFASARRELKALGAFSAVGGRSVVLGEDFAQPQVIE